MSKIIEIKKHGLENTVNEIIKAFNNNKTVIAPSDTVYGFLAPYDNAFIQNKIREIKVRDKKPFIHLVNSVDMLKEISSTCIPDKLLPLLPAPLTLIVESNKISTLDNSVALRYPDKALLLYVMNITGKPCISTSANLSGRPIPEDAADMISLFKDTVDLIVLENEWNTLPSTILDIRKTPYKLVRKGCVAIPDEMLG